MSVLGKQLCVFSFCYCFWVILASNRQIVFLSKQKQFRSGSVPEVVPEVKTTKKRPARPDGRPRQITTNKTTFAEEPSTTSCFGWLFFPRHPELFRNCSGTKSGSEALIPELIRNWSGTLWLKSGTLARKRLLTTIFFFLTAHILNIFSIYWIYTVYIYIWYVYTG